MWLGNRIRLPNPKSILQIRAAGRRDDNIKGPTKSDRETGRATEPRRARAGREHPAGCGARRAESVQTHAHAAGHPSRDGGGRRGANCACRLRGQGDVTGSCAAQNDGSAVFWRLVVSGQQLVLPWMTDLPTLSRDVPGLRAARDHDVTPGHRRESELVHTQTGKARQPVALSDTVGLDPVEFP